MCIYQLLQPHRSTVTRLRAIHRSLSGAVPECVTLWNRTCCEFASVMLMTTGIGECSSRVRRALPSVQASCDVKCGRVREASRASMSSSCSGAFCQREGSTYAWRMYCTSLGACPICRDMVTVQIAQWMILLSPLWLCKSLALYQPANNFLIFAPLSLRSGACELETMNNLVILTHRLIRGPLYARTQAMQEEKARRALWLICFVFDSS